MSKIEFPGLERLNHTLGELTKPPVKLTNGEYTDLRKSYEHALSTVTGDRSLAAEGFLKWLSSEPAGRISRLAVAVNFAQRSYKPGDDAPYVGSRVVSGILSLDSKEPIFERDLLRRVAIATDQPAEGLFGKSKLTI